VPTCSDLLADLTKERERITKAVPDLQTSRAALDNVIAAAPPMSQSAPRAAQQPAAHGPDRHRPRAALPPSTTS
jgi:hypothetical protein